jgi:hypothetical protein
LRTPAKTRWPARASLSTHALPIPFAAPVTNMVATFNSRFDWRFN